MSDNYVKQRKTAYNMGRGEGTVHTGKSEGGNSVNFEGRNVPVYIEKNKAIFPWLPLVLGNFQKK